MRTRTMDRVRVFVVEDQDLVRAYLCETVSKAPGFDLAGAAGTAEDALKALTTLDVDLVVMDVGLPAMGGIQATRVLKATRPRLTVLMLSGDDQHIPEAMEAGAAGYVLKVSTPEQFVQGMTEVLPQRLNLQRAG